jgi:hypothetical protein
MAIPDRRSVSTAPAETWLCPGELVWQQLPRRYRYDYTVYAAIEDEYNDGWVWLQCPNYPSRTLIQLRNPENGRVTYCEARHIDQNFLDRYRGDPERTTVHGGISIPEQALVISEWYRNALGGFDTSARRRERAEKEGRRAITTTLIEIRPLFRYGWGALRAASHHPDIAVRVGTRLGMLGVWLGLVGLIGLVLDKRAPFSELAPAWAHISGTDPNIHFIAWLLVAALVFALLCGLPCRAPRRLKRHSQVMIVDALRTGKPPARAKSGGSP